jgi:hypothetical protein
MTIEVDPRQRLLRIQDTPAFQSGQTRQEPPKAGKATACPVRIEGRKRSYRPRPSRNRHFTETGLGQSTRSAAGLCPNLPEKEEE